MCLLPQPHINADIFDSFRLYHEMATSSRPGALILIDIEAEKFTKTRDRRLVMNPAARDRATRLLAIVWPNCKHGSQAAVHIHAPLYAMHLLPKVRLPRSINWWVALKYIEKVYYCMNPAPPLQSAVNGLSQYTHASPCSLCGDDRT